MSKLLDKQKALSLSIFLCSLVLICFSCQELTNGCTDSFASNFSISADEDCCLIEEECCCTYPSLTLNLFYKGRAADTLSQSSTNIRLGQYYALDNLIDSIRIDSFSLFISNLQAINTTDLDTVRLFETLELSFIDANGVEQVTSFEDNITLVSMPTFSFDIGTYSSDIAYDEVTFDIGLEPDLATIDPNSVDNDHPLGDEYTILYDTTNARFLTGRLGFTLTNGLEEQSFSHEIDGFSSESDQFLTPISIDKGEDLDILMRINVLDIFKGIIFDVSSTDVESIINNNLASSISVLE
jgi:hypothetical protein